MVAAGGAVGVVTRGWTEGACAKASGAVDRLAAIKAERKIVLVVMVDPDGPTGIAAKPCRGSGGSGSVMSNPSTITFDPDLVVRMT